MVLFEANICTLHDVGAHDGIDYLVMEHLEGETLADRLKRGALPPEQALEFGRQIASALAAAHELGIVHRDLKPGNVMLTKSGAKLLDFGLAKWEERSRSVAPTEARPLTQEGALLGTIAYMAPEQLEGKEADARSDIYAFGAVLYEMVTGRRAYDEEHRREFSPPLLESIVSRALVKSPAERWQSVRDIEILLGLPRTPAPALPPRRRFVHAIWASLVVLTALVAWWSRPAPRAEVTRLTVTLPEGQSLYNDLSPPFAIAPDGRELVLASRDSNRSDSALYVRNLDSFEVQRLEGTTDARQPVFSPDGQSIAFGAGGRPVVYRIARNGGPAIKLCDTPASPRGLAWTTRGAILFGTETSGIWSVSENGGHPVPVTTLAPDETGHWNPSPLPGNRGLLFTALRVGAGGNPDVALLPQDATEHQVLFPGQYAAYVPSGHLVSGRSGSSELLAVLFDIADLKVQGSPIQLPATIALNANWNPQLRVGANGTLVYAPGDDSHSTVVWVDRNGIAAMAATSDRRYHTVHLSPDGKRFAADEAGPSEHVWVHDLERGTRALAASGANLQTPRFNPNAEVLAYSNFENIFVKATDGSGDARPLAQSERILTEPSWSSDGTLLAFTDTHPDTGEDLWVLTLGESPRPFLVTPARENASAFSPDGRWIAYQSDTSGRQEIYVQPFPGPGTRQVISTNGGKEPVWSPDGRELFYRESTALMAVPVETTDSFRAGLPKRLFDGPYVADNAGHASYDVSPDGTKFLMIQNDERGLTELRVVLNFAEELKALLPPK